ncbi:MAG: sulfatase [Tannerella sp.]|jgi:arylsulfatase A-like enzyme|nr:sulfatase [Tannerella sp.]
MMSLIIMKNIIHKCWLSLASVSCFGITVAETVDQEQRPNIILFLVDDMGWQDTSLPFWKEKTPYNEIYETPNMERLAKQGMMFTQAYASSISSPSRCSLMTGMNVARHRVTNWTLEKNKTTDLESDLLQLPDWNYNGICQVSGINNTYQVTSLPQILKDNGYHTIHCGKAHFGAIDTPGENPYHFGFEVNIAGHAAGGLASYLGEDNFGNRTDGQKNLFAIPGLEKYWGDDIFVTEALTIEARKAMDHALRLEQPFFLYMSHYAIHIPLDKDKRYYDKYIRKGLSENEAAYAALIEGMDKSLGDLMDWVEANGQQENTIFIFMSDNGGLASSSHWRSGELHVQNYPLNSGKGSAYEGGIREPMIVSWPGKVVSQSKCDNYLVIEDFFPTILEMAQIETYETLQPVDGISFVPLLTTGSGNPSKDRCLYWNCPNIWGNTGPGIGVTCTVRENDWKLIYYYDSGKKELFNIADDIGERNNLATIYPEIVTRLSTELGSYLREVGGQRPSFKATGKPCPWPDEI